MNESVSMDRTRPGSLHTRAASPNRYPTTTTTTTSNRSGRVPCTHLPSCLLAPCSHFHIHPLTTTSTIMSDPLASPPPTTQTHTCPNAPRRPPRSRSVLPEVEEIQPRKLDFDSAVEHKRKAEGEVEEEKEAKQAKTEDDADIEESMEVETYKVAKAKLIELGGEEIIDELRSHVPNYAWFRGKMRRDPPIIVPDHFYIQLTKKEGVETIEYLKDVDCEPFLEMEECEAGYGFLLALFRAIGTRME